MVSITALINQNLCLSLQKLNFPEFQQRVYQLTIQSLSVRTIWLETEEAKSIHIMKID